MAGISNGSKLVHTRSPNFISEHVDQFVGVAYTSGNENRVSLTIGRDMMNVTNETFHEVSPGSFQTRVGENDVDLTRVDFASFSMSMDSAKRLHELLSQMIENGDRSEQQA